MDHKKVYARALHRSEPSQDTDINSVKVNNAIECNPMPCFRTTPHELDVHTSAHECCVFDCG